jgi:YegS/Rv2252/BmrU family lipid kinase
MGPVPARDVVLIVNPSAGGGRGARALPAIQARLGELGLSVLTESTRDLNHARELAAAAASAGRLTVTLGGDGLAGCVAGVLREHPGSVLGILPGGRGNDFARVLGIPLEPGPACGVLARGVQRELDLGEADGHVFVGIASCGFDSDANRIANATRIVRGNLVYTYGALRALLSWRPATFTVTLEDREPLTITGYTVAAANSKAYGGGMYLAPDASLEDGLLDIVITGNVPRLRFLRLLPTVFKGEHVKLPDVHVMRAASVTISADRPFTLYADGDPIAELPVRVRTLPRAVRVMVPA